MKKTTAALTLLLAACAAQADVFSLWSSFRPSSSQGASAAASSAEEMLAAKKLWTEPVVVNGSELGLGIALVDADFETCAARLREAYPKAPCAGNADELLMEIKLENGRRLRVYIVRMPGIGPVMQFTMELPSKLAQTPQWPAELPLPPSSTPLTVMRFPNRSSVYGYFSSALSPDQALADMRKNLLSSGWKVAGDDGGSNVSGGDFYLKEKPLSVSIVGANADENGQTRGSAYSRKIGK